MNLYLNVRNFLFPQILLRRQLEDAANQIEYLFKEKDSLMEQIIELRKKYEPGHVAGILAKIKPGAEADCCGGGKC